MLCRMDASFNDFVELEKSDKCFINKVLIPSTTAGPYSNGG